MFINSLGSDLPIWDAAAAESAPDFRIIRYGKRDHGLSDTPKGPCSIRDHSQDLRRLLDELEVAHPGGAAGTPGLSG